MPWRSSFLAFVLALLAAFCRQVLALRSGWVSTTGRLRSSQTTARPRKRGWVAVVAVGA